MRLRTSDLRLMLDTITPAESVELTVHDNHVEFEFSDGNKRFSTIIIYNSLIGGTPEIRQTAKLYRKM